MKILVTTDKYYPRPYANAVCAQELIYEFVACGHQVDVLAYKDYGIECPEKWNGNRIFYVKPDLRNKLFFYANNKHQN